MKTIDISRIRINGGTQSRAAINKDVVAEYAEAMEGGATFPPVIVFYDGANYWLADGFHRYEAYARARINDVPADVRQGTQRDAILFSVGANASHGLRRTNDDKRRAVMVLLNDPEWSKWSNREIARQCGVSEKLVRDVRGSICDKNADSVRTVTRSGTTFQQETARIGTAQKAERAAPETVAEVDEGGAAPEPEAEPEPEADPMDPEEAKLRREFRTLSKQAQEDAYVGLSLDLRDAKAKGKKQAEEIRVLKAHVKGFEGDQADTIRRQAQIIAHKSSEVFRANEKADKALAKAKVLENRVKELEAMGIKV